MAGHNIVDRLISCRLFFRLEGQEVFFLLHQFLHLFDKPDLDLGEIVKFFHRGTLPQRLVHDELTVAGGSDQKLQQLFLGLFVIILRIAQPITAIFQAADSLLEGFFIGLANAHDFAHSPHLGPQLILDALEFFKGPASEFDDDIIAVRHVFIQRSVFAAGDIVQIQPAGQHGGYQCDRETGGFRSQRRGTGGPRVDLDDDDPVGYRVMSKLYVGAADDANLVYDPISLFLQPFLDLFRDGQHRCGTEGVAGVDAHGVDVFNEADGDHIAFGVPDHFQLQFLPAQNGLFHQDLAHDTGLKPSGTNRLQLFSVIYQAAAFAAHGIRRTKDYRIPQFFSDRQGFLHGFGDVASGHFHADFRHGPFEFFPVLTSLDGIHLNADDFNAVFVQYPGFRQFGTQVQSGLTAQIWQQRIRPLLGDDLFDPLNIQRFDIGHISCLRVRHDGGRIGIHQHDLVSEIFQSLAGLGAGIVEFTGLTDDDGAGADDHYFMDICSFHIDPSRLDR